jgi:hypothetical protein
MNEPDKRLELGRRALRKLPSTDDSFQDWTNLALSRIENVIEPIWMISVYSIPIEARGTASPVQPNFFSASLSTPKSEDVSASVGVGQPPLS